MTLSTTQLSWVQDTAVPGALCATLGVGAAATVAHVRTALFGSSVLLAAALVVLTVNVSSRRPAGPVVTTRLQEVS